jgi:hypothetical protein
MTVTKSVIGAKREQEEVMTIRIMVTTAVVMTGVIGNNAVKRAAVEKEDIIGHRRIVCGPKRGVGNVIETHHLAKKIAAAIVAAIVAMIAAARRHHQDAILPNVAKSRHTKNHHLHPNQSLHQKNPMLTMCK